MQHGFTTKIVPEFPNSIVYASIEDNCKFMELMDSWSMKILSE